MNIMNKIEGDDVKMRDVSLQHYETTQALEHAAQQAIERRYEDFLIVDVDFHHYENEAWPEIVEYITDPVLRHHRRSPGPREARHGRRPRVVPGAERPHHPLSWTQDREDAADFASGHHADAALDGCDGHRHRMLVPHAHAQSLAIT